MSQVRWAAARSYYWWDRKGKGWLELRTTVVRVPLRLSRGTGLMSPYPLAHQGMDYSEFLRFLNAQLGPTGYLEIGTHQGIASRRCHAMQSVLTPDFMIDRNIVGKRSCLFLFQMASTTFSPATTRPI